MTSTFRTAGAWGAGVGRPLTWVEQDNNTYDKETRLADLESLISVTGGGAVGIANIEVSGGVLIITMTDASQYTFALPLPELTAQGEWQPSSLYHAQDIITYGGSAYLVTTDHTSATSFDPNEMASTSQPVYQFLWSFAPAPGFERTDATFTPTLADANSYNVMTNASGCAVTIDPTEDFPDWTEFHFRDESTDTSAFCAFNATAPATISGMNGYLNQTAGQGSVVTLKKFGASDVWHLFGHLAVA